LGKSIFVVGEFSGNRIKKAVILKMIDHFRKPRNLKVKGKSF